MFLPDTIQSCFTGMVGMRQHSNKNYPRYDDTLTSSLLGIYIDNSAHSLLTIDNIAAIAQNFLAADINDYDAAVTYSKGEIVISASIVYESLVDSNLAHTPVSSTTQWKATNYLSSYLRALINSASLNLFNAVVQKKKLYEAGKTLLSDTNLYDGVGNLARRVTKFSRFVGFRISPNAKDTVVTISAAGFQFDTINPAFQLYVYHSSSNVPLSVTTLALTKAITFEWSDLATKIPMAYNGATTNSRGYFYVGYYEDDVVGQAIWKEQGFSGSACGSCNSLDAYLYRSWNKYFSVQPFYVENAWLDNVDRNLFDEEKLININNQNWGMNFKMQVTCDVSDFICRNKYVFAEPLRKQIVHDLLRDMAYSMRNNQLKEKVAQLAAYALENQENKTKGVKAELEDAISAVSFDMSSISELCLPCNGAGSGITVKSIF